MNITNVSIDSISPTNIRIGTDRDDDGIATKTAYNNNSSNITFNLFLIAKLSTMSL